MRSTSSWGSWSERLIKVYRYCKKRQQITDVLWIKLLIFTLERWPHWNGINHDITSVHVWIPHCNFTQLGQRSLPHCWFVHAYAVILSVRWVMGEQFRARRSSAAPKAMTNYGTDRNWVGANHCKLWYYSLMLTQCLLTLRVMTVICIQMWD